MQCHHEPGWRALGDVLRECCASPLDEREMEEEVDEVNENALVEARKGSREHGSK